MSETRNDISKANIRSQLNLIYASMKLLSALLELAMDNALARKTLVSMAESVCEQTAALYRDVVLYATSFADEAEYDDMLAG